MFKRLVTLTLAVVLLVTTFGFESEAATRKTKKTKSGVSYKSKSFKNRKNRSKKFGKRYRKSGNGPDLRRGTSERTRICE